MNKMVKMAIVLVALASVFSFADEDKGGFKMGFTAGVGGSSNIGLLFNLGSGIEAGLGLRYHSETTETTTEATGNPTNKAEVSESRWAIAPSASYQLRKKDLISYGAGLDLAFSSWSHTQPDPSTGNSVTTKPDGIDMWFDPNFYIKVEPVNNFVLGLKTGIDIYLRANKENKTSTTKITEKHSEIGTFTSVFVAFYL